MNILFICHEKDINGASRSMFDLIDALKSKHNFYILLRFNSGEVYDEVNNRNIKWFYAPYKWWASTNPPTKLHLLIRKLKWALFWRQSNIRMANIISEELKPYNIDIIHTNSGVVNFGCYLTKILETKHIWHIREFGIEDFNTYNLASTKEQKYCFSNYTDGVVTISKGVMNKYKRLVPPEKLTMIYNGVSQSNLYHKQIYNLDTSRPLILLQSGAISIAKRQDIAIKAVRELKKRGINVHLKIAGAGSLDSVGENIADLSDRVEILGKVNNLKEIRKEVDIELVCSNCEAFGRVTIEAMMSSLPVIGTNSGGTIELIKNNETGLLFNTGEYIALANCLEYVDCNRNLLEEMGIEGYNYAKDQFTIETCANKIDLLYEKIMGG